MKDPWAWFTGALTLAITMLVLAACSDGPKQDPTSSEISSVNHNDTYDGAKSIWISTVDGRRIPCVMWWHRSFSGVSCDWSAR